MNLKYYLRGLGAGIVVTAIIMSIATDDPKEKLSDAEIKARAAELGMVESSSGLLSELEPEATELPKETKAPEPTELPKETETPEPTASPKDTEKPRPSATVKAEENPQQTQAPSGKPTSEIIIVEINSGEGSYTICKRLEENGLIASAADFDTYLCDRGLDKRLRAGSYEIPEDAKPEEIAKILTF